MKTESIGIITMGCPKNMVDSEKIAAAIRKAGLNVEHEDAEAKIILINTCAFINDAKEESINEILFHVERKKNDENVKVFVFGCMAQRYKDELKKEIPEVDGYFNFDEVNKLIELLTKDKTMPEIDRVLSTPTHYAYLKISEGCNRTCSFCAIPKIRGKMVSVPEEKLLEEAKMLAEKGVKELIIIAQDTVSYGIDIYGEKRIAKLLNKVSKIDGIEWIRLMYTYPAGFPGDLIDEIASNPKILKYIDIPLQHINSDILKSMNRAIDKEGVELLIEKLRKKIPNLAIRSTFIVGYPGEKAKDFLELANFIKKARFERFGVFAYSPEEDTPAFVLPDNVSAKVKMKRMSDLLQIHEKINIEQNNLLIGKKIEVIIDDFSEDEKCFLGRTSSDAPEIDNIVIIYTSKKLNIGDIVSVKVTSIGVFEIICEY
ncbi:MAG: 30S ribosomal protein S12 methylthiotransferase RimO [Bacteroidales bacterium]|nr:30S ribosomal protein S12 methylthiotransferase RimO [Bacteroidales bacterium]